MTTKIEKQVVSSQDSGYGEFAGSLDDVVSDVCRAFCDQAICPGSRVLAVFPEYVLAYQTELVSETGSLRSYDWRTDRSYSYDAVDVCWKYPYNFDTTTDVVTFSEPTQVTMEVVLTEVNDQTAIAIGGVPSPADYQSSTTAPASVPETTYVAPPSAQKAARKGLALSSAWSYGQGTDSDGLLAVKIASGQPISQSEMSMISRFFELNSRSTLDIKQSRPVEGARPSRAEIDWLRWGGDAMMVTSAALVKKIQQDDQGDDLLLTQSVEHDSTLNFNAMIQSVKRDDKTRIIEIEGIATIGDIFNSKGEVYPTTVWQSAVPAIQSQIDQCNFTGCVEHPQTLMESLKETCIIFSSWAMQGDQALFKAKVLPTIPDGHNLQLLLESGMNIEMSTRCHGSFKREKWLGQDAWVVQPGMVCKGVDAVRAGASTGSRVTDHKIIQSAANPAHEENTLTDEELRKAISDALAANNQAQAEEFKAMLQTATAALVPPAPAPAPVEDTATKTALNQMQLVRQAERRGDKLVQDASANPFVAKQLKQHVERLVQEAEDGTITSIQEFDAETAKITKIAQDMYEALPDKQKTALTQSVNFLGGKIPVGYAHPDSMIFHTPAELAPRDENAMIEHLIRNLSDEPVHGGGMNFFQSVDMGDGTTYDFPRGVRSQRGQCRQILQNMRDTYIGGIGGFNGRQELKALCLLEQQRKEEATALLQSVPDGATAVGAGGAPLTTAFIFPLYVQLFPTLFSNEISSVQPMSRPDGRIFFKRSYRITPGQNWTDEAGNVISDRTPIDLAGGAIDPTYSDDPGEFQPSSRIQLRFASKSVQVEGKKLSVETSIEEVMDLRAYFNLDVMQEMMGDLSIEIAQEINMAILADLLGAASGSRAQTYSVTMPSGYTSQQAWEQYLGRVVQSVSNEIYKVRNGEMTHIVAGPDAWFALSAGYNINAIPGSPNPGLYAGLQAGFINNPVFTNVKMYKTNLWSQTNRNKILIIRKGDTWSDTPHVYAPYADYMSPVLVIPDTMSQTQGYMHRAASFAVASSAVGSVTIASGTGAEIAFPTAS